MHGCTITPHNLGFRIPSGLQAVVPSGALHGHAVSVLSWYEGQPAFGFGAVGRVEVRTGPVETASNL